MTATPGSTPRPTPRWRRALGAAGLAGFGTLFLEYWQAMGWIDGVTSAAPPAPIELDQALPLVPWSRVHFSHLGDTVSVGWTPGWAALVVAVVVFLVAWWPWWPRDRAAR